MHKFLVCACKSHGFAQSQEIFARSHDRETVTFRNSGQLLVRFYPSNIEVTFLQPAVQCQDLSLDKSTLGISELPPALKCILCQSMVVNYISLLACDETICQ